MKNHRCEDCEKSFYQDSSLQQHKKDKHSKKVLSKNHLLRTDCEKKIVKIKVHDIFKSKKKLVHKKKSAIQAMGL